MKKLIFIYVLFCLLATQAFAQEQVKGLVIDATDGSALIGVSVLKKGTTVGTATDVNGNFSLQANRGDVLIFSYIGYASLEVTASTQPNWTISLEPESITLQEVVAVGYGTVRKRDLTGSVSSVKGENLTRIQTPNIGQALIGQTPGVLITSPSGEGPGTDPKIIIRGENSINGNNDPLWVIDGFTGAGGANTVNPEDIESIEILKDASATAIYGSRGAGGVIIVTTKKGAKNRKPIVELKATFGVQKLTRELNLMTGQEYYQYWQNSGINNYFDKNIDPTGNYDWRKEVTRQALQQNYFLSLYGGNDRISYKITADYYDQEGIIKYNNDYKRLNIRSQLEVDVNKYIKAGITGYMQRTWRNNGGGGGNYQSAVEMSPLIPIYTADGGYNHYLGERDLSVLSSNFIENIRDNKNKQETNSNNIQAFISIEPIKKLVFKTTGALNYYTHKNQNFSPKHLDLKNQINNANANERQSNDYEWINTLSYIRDFNKNHTINAVVGYTYESKESYDVSASGQNFPTDDFGYWAIGSGPIYELPEEGLPIIRNSGSTGYSESTLMSFLGRINYTFKDRYLFTLTGRYDGASQLAKDHKWAFFPSAAIAWRASEEAFIKNIEVFSNLKVRISWGRTGSQGINSYSTLGLASRGEYSLQDGVFAPIYYTNNLPNPNLTWEKTNQTNIGADFGFFNNRLRFSIDYYHKKTFDMFVSKNLPAETGFGSYLSNDGEMENKGYEFELSGEPYISRDWKISAGVNFSLNRNKVLYMGGDDFKVYTNKNSYGGLLSYNYVGKPVSLIYGWVYDGIWQNEEEIRYGAVDVEAGTSQTRPGDMRYKDINKDGKIDQKDKVQILNPHPDFVAAFNGNISYKNISLSFMFQGMFGHQIYNYTKKNLFNQLAFRKNAWTEGSGIYDQPSAGNENVKDSDYFVEEGSFVKLRNVTLSYTLPKTVVEKSGFGNVEVYFTGKDLFTITGYSGYNPEVSRNGNSESFRGIDYNSYPSTLSLFAGIKVSF